MHHFFYRFNSSFKIIKQRCIIKKKELGIRNLIIDYQKLQITNTVNKSIFRLKKKNYNLGTMKSLRVQS